MKSLVTALIALAALGSTAQSAQAAEVQSAKQKVQIARVVDLVKLVNKPDLQVSVAVQDLGGSTDVSPTQTVYLTIYSKGEMFSTDAAFKIADVIMFTSAKRLEGGRYEVKFMNAEMKNATVEIDARKAITELKNVRCEDFDCDASTNFKSSILVNEK